MKHAVIAQVLSVALVIGCGTVERGQPTPWTSAYRERTGQVTPHDLAVRLPRVLARNGFLIERVEERSRDYIFQTHWKQRLPFDDEKSGGYEAARTRLRLRAHWDGRLYVLHFEAENQVQTRSGEWIRIASTDMFEAYARTVASDIRLEIASGMRRY